jgi:hypothetical protein
METVKVLSPVQDKKIRENLDGSPIWKTAYTVDELKIAEKNHTELYEYSVKFDGLRPVQVTGVKKLVK